ncbi:MAG: hypothetical protein AOA65_0578 [Candidatus Bathyarchaeota archaeon BA1]|nr:MAG: hypothetical protein AOA65_0578 [Candidatus Bathyarchaeota archaeon BA1]
MLKWLLSYSLLLVPCVIADVIMLLYFVKKEKLTEALKNPKIRIPIIIILAGIPFLVATMMLYMWLA